MILPGVVAIIAAVGGIAFWFTWRGLDAKEDEMNLIPESAYKGRENAPRSNSVRGDSDV